MNSRQKLFVQEYLVDLNATAAAERAGYKTPNKTGPRLLVNAGIKAEIEQRQAKLSRKLDISAQNVVNELARVGFFDPRKLYNDDGSLKDIRELDDDTAAAVASVEVVEETKGRGEDQRVIRYTKKIRLWDKVAALEKLGKHLNLFKDDQVNVTMPMVTVISFGDAPDVSQHFPPPIAERLLAAGSNGVHPDNEAGSA